MNDRSQLERLYPPRTEVIVHPKRLARFRGFWAQFKYNDIRTLIFLFANGQISLLTRKRQHHREYRLTSRMREALRGLSLKADRNHVFDGGILRNFVSPKTGERPIVLWDILVHDDEYLLASQYRERYRLLERVCGNPARVERETQAEIGLVVRNQLWLAPVFRDRFEERFQSTLGPDFLEGLVLKNPSGRLEPGLTELNNSGWQFKVRKPRADYPF